MGEMRGAYNTLGETGNEQNLKGKRPFGKLKLRWGDNIKIDIREAGCERVDWIDLSRNRVQ
jgi:hypothetical protein